MRIAIIGKGTSSIITALNFIHHGYNVEIFYDPKKSHISVGESTTPHIALLLKKVFGITTINLISEGIVSLKTGVNFIGWGESNSFNHDFSNDLIAFHFETTKFNPFIHNLLEKRGVKYHAKKVTQLEFDNSSAILDGVRYDFVVNCSGWSNQNKYKKPFFETVNSGILYTKNEIVHHNKTLHEATEDGWQFGLPFPDRNITKHGYLFNSKISDSEKVKEKFKEIDYKFIEWEQKYSEDLIHNPHYASNGNRLFFIEPLQALSLLYYNEFSELLVSYINNGKNLNTKNKINNQYDLVMFEYQLSLALHYSYGSKYKTDFWNNVSVKSKEFMEIYPFTQQRHLDRTLTHDLMFNDHLLKIGSFEKEDYMKIDYGMKNLGNPYLVLNDLGYQF
jgi:hypothetical protein